MIYRKNEVVGRVLARDAEGRDGVDELYGDSNQKEISKQVDFMLCF